MVLVRGDQSFLTQPVTVSSLAETFDGPAPVYQCLKDAVAIPGAARRTLELPAVTADQTGSYSLMALNAAGQTRSAARFLTVRSRLLADLTFKAAPSTPAGFALIPAGAFQMGDSFGEGEVAERPLRRVTVSAFYMAQRETTKALWDEVRAWGISRGYTDLPVGGGKGSHHPVQTVTWFDVIKWCNARSEKEGLTPCYTVGGSPLRTGTVIPVVNWTAKGYRLPTEAEWEKAARGGLKKKRFPWGDTIDHGQVNYQSNEKFTPDISAMRGFHPTYDTGDFPYTSPVGSFKANGYGLYDMTGNVWEWCWDWYGTYPSGQPTDPKGSASGLVRVQRGGSWGNYAYFCRVSARDRCNPFLSDYALGFRVVLFADASARAAPIVTTGVAVGGDGAGIFTVSGSVIADGGSPVTARGVVFGLVPEPTLTSSMVSPSGAGSGDFSSNLKNLLLDTTYYARAYATSSIGTAYGVDITFNTASSTPVGFALIPAGTFQMGDALDGMSDAPVHTVNVSAFYIGKTEVTKGEWDEVRSWGTSRGYTDLAAGAGKASNHPVTMVSWWDVIKWCNARSEKDGLEPCYRVGGNIMRTGATEPTPNWVAKGYRLPTEAEWEKAARGGLNGKRFPWGDTISHSQANYRSDTTRAYDVSPTRGYHPIYGVGIMPYIAPVSGFAANGYGLHDMAGNVWEWCWDWYGAYAVGDQSNPRGVTTGAKRVIRSGYWYDNSIDCRAADRNNGSPNYENDSVGFRMLRGYPPSMGQVVPTVVTGAAVAGAALTSFTVSGEVTNDGGAPVTKRGIVYGLTATPTLGAAMDAPADGTGTGAFSSALTGLTPETNYYARAYATSSIGTAYGVDITFNTASSTPVGFAFIPAGTFQMGDSFGEGDAGERPLRRVTVSAFYMAQHETTKALWDEVRVWAASRGYTDLPVGGGKAATHPVQEVNWFDVIKWCNARSEKEGLTPCYTVSGSPLRTGTVIPVVNWKAKGYRLPTEAEWEKSARGGLNGKRFPWGDAMSHGQANYHSSSEYAYDISSTRGFHPSYIVGEYTSPVGSFVANGYGLFDMAGNSFEWCWDWYRTYAAGAQTDPNGSVSGSLRVIRGGSWGLNAYYCRVSNRSWYDPSTRNNILGFRVVLYADSSARTAPIVTTGAAVPGDGAGTFTVSGVVTSDGGSPVTARGVVYGLVPEPTLKSSMVSPSGTRSGDFSSNLNNLVLDTTYYARAYATNVLGTRYGAGITFKTAPATPVGFALIPAGAFQMGDALDGGSDAVVRTVNVSAFYMAKTEVTKADWNEVRAWGISRGYTDLAVGGGKAINHPVQNVTWWDAIKWCNARSEKDGLKPCYRVGGNIMRTGVTEPTANWAANGYRLPTEAEWEKAARGGLIRKRFPWGDTISHSQANYFSDSLYAYDVSPTRGYHPQYLASNEPFTSPVGSFAANGFGLHDMAGNVLEWCWDWVGDYATAASTDPRGASSGTLRITRGGMWNGSLVYCRVADRNWSGPFGSNFFFGFRPARGK